jgi:hypothetical protein
MILKRRGRFVALSFQPKTKTGKAHNCDFPAFDQLGTKSVKTYAATDFLRDSFGGVLGVVLGVVLSLFGG